MGPVFWIDELVVKHNDRNRARFHRLVDAWQQGWLHNDAGCWRCAVKFNSWKRGCG